MKLSLVEWLQEREANCRRHAARNYGAEKAGWLEDADYFKSAAALATTHAGGAAQQSDQERRVRIPTEENEAAMMVLLGANWLSENAPHRMKSLASQAEPNPAPAPQASEPLTTAQISDLCRDAQIAFCLNKESSYDIALVRAVERALRAATPQAKEPK